MRLPILALTALAATSATSRADVVLGNMGADGSGGYATNYTLIGSGNISGLAFNTGNSSLLSLQSITIGSFIDSTGTFTISLYGGSSSQPSGSALFVSDGYIRTASSEAKFTYFFESAVLDANTTYWVVPDAGQSWATSASFSNATAQNSSGYSFVANRRSTNGGTTWGDFIPYSISIEATTPVPEPSAYGLVLGGLALAGAAIRRRKAAR